MPIFKTLYQKIDPERLIPVKVWLLISALGGLCCFLFAATLWLITVGEQSIHRANEVYHNFGQRLELNNDLDSLQLHVGFYEQNLASFFASSHPDALKSVQKAKTNIRESQERIARQIRQPRSMQILQTMGALIDSTFAADEIALNSKQAPVFMNPLALQLKVAIFSKQMMNNRADMLYQQLGEYVGDNRYNTRTSSIPVAILTGLLFFLLLYFSVKSLRRVLSDRRAYKKVLAEYKKSAEYTQNILNILPIGYHSVDKNGIILEMNQTELDWLGYTREEMIGKFIPDLFDDTFIAQSEAIRAKFLQDQQLNNLEITMIAKNGQHLPMLVTSKAIYDDAGVFSHSISGLYNFTDRKKLEVELTAAHEEAENAHRIKQLFMANMSHEIRTPLNAILGFANLLGRHKLAPELTEYVECIQTSGTNLLGIVNDILDFEKIQSGMLRLEQIEFDLAGLLHSVVTMVRPAAEEKQLKLQLHAESDLPAVLLGDPMRLTQILINLLGNAIKFTQTGTVVLRAHAIASTLSDAEVMVRFEVEDSGIGIAQEEHQRIFERFIQASSDMSRKFGGTGLGLALVKMLVELQHGSISLVSALNKGSTFTVEIPYQTTRSEVLDKSVPQVTKDLFPDLSGFHVLLVEDNQMNRRIAELYLLQFKLKVTQAVDGREALDLLNAKPNAFDLVFMDIQMPRLDGYATAKAIRHELKLTNLPIVAMTAHVLAGEREKVLACGMNDYLTKPVKQNEIAIVLLRYLANFWDSVAAHDFSGNNAANFREIAGLFIQQFPTDLANLEAALQKSDMASVVQQTHNLRSTVGYAGFQASLGKILLQLEKEAQAEHPDVVLLFQLYDSILQDSHKALSIIEREIKLSSPRTKPLKAGKLNILLADDDKDDYLLFKLALAELPIPTQLSTVKNGEMLMQMLHDNPDKLPDIIFLDLNMPRKNGFQCLGEIKQDDRLKHIPVVIYSTSFQKEVVTMLYNYGAHHYIQKPNDFMLVKQIIQHAINSVSDNNQSQPSKESFVLFPEA